MRVGSTGSDGLIAPGRKMLACRNVADVTWLRSYANIELDRSLSCKLVMLAVRMDSHSVRRATVARSAGSCRRPMRMDCQMQCVGALAVRRSVFDWEQR